MMMMMQNEAAASSTCRALLGRRCPRRGERRGEEKCLCCGIYSMCIMKGIEEQELELSCWSCVREGGPGVPCGHLFSGHHALSPALSQCPALLGETGWELWELLGQWKAQGEGGWQGIAQRRGGGCPGQCPPAQQRCSARGSLGLGMSCFGPQGEFCVLLGMRQDHRMHSTAPLNSGMVGCWFPGLVALCWQQSPRACPQGLGVPALPGAVLAHGLGCVQPRGVLQAARSTGLCSLGNHSPAWPGAPCCCPGAGEGAGEGGEELQIIVPWAQSLCGAGGTVSVAEPRVAPC